MKHLTGIFYLTAFLFANIVNAQDSAGRQYNNSINKAELYITEGKYDEALKHYNEAFTSTGIEFGIDLYNAAVCAKKEKNTKQLFLFADKLAEKGVGAKFFERKIFKDYMYDKAFQKIINKAEEVKHKKLKANERYMQDLDEFIKLDSTYNKLRLTEYHDSWELPDTLETLFRDNTRNMLNYINEKGYFSENKLGVNIASDTIFTATRSPNIVFLHYLEMGKDKMLQNEIKDLYISKMYNGELKPNSLSHTIEMGNWIFGDTGSYVFKIFECEIYKLREVPNLDQINRNREMYLQGNLDDFEKKLVYKYCHNTDFEFCYSLIGSPASKEDYFYTASNVIGEVKDCKKG